MNVGTRVRVLALATVAAAALGIYLVTTQGPALTTVGILLIIGSAILFLADVKDMLILKESEQPKRPTP